METTFTRPAQQFLGVQLNRFRLDLHEHEHTYDGQSTFSSRVSTDEK